MNVSRELAYRHQDGLEVTLLWNAASNEVSIALHDDRTETAFSFLVDAKCALDAFNHPFAYAPSLDDGPDQVLALAGLTWEG